MLRQHSEKHQDSRINLLMTTRCLHTSLTAAVLDERWGPKATKKIQPSEAGEASQPNHRYSRASMLII